MRNWLLSATLSSHPFLDTTLNSPPPHGLSYCTQLCDGVGGVTARCFSGPCCSGTFVGFCVLELRSHATTVCRFARHDSIILLRGCWVTLHTLHSSSCVLHVVLYVLRASMCDLVCRWGNWYSHFYSKLGSRFPEEGGRVAGDMRPSATCSLPQTYDSAHRTSTRDGLCVVPRLPDLTP
jgi:hypothetical protein